MFFIYGFRQLKCTSWLLQCFANKLFDIKQFQMLAVAKVAEVINNSECFQKKSFDTESVEETSIQNSRV